MQSTVLTIVSVGLCDSFEIKRELGDAAGVELILRHNAALRKVLAEFSEGQELEKQGDSFLLGFPKPAEAVCFALRFQRTVRARFADALRPILDSIAIHVGNVFFEPGDAPLQVRRVFGMPVDLCRLLRAVAKPGQIFLTRFPFEYARQALRSETRAQFDDLQWINHGLCVVKGIEDPVEICEVGEKGISPLTAPVSCEGPLTSEVTLFRRN